MQVRYGCTMEIKTYIKKNNVADRQVCLYFYEGNNGEVVNMKITSPQKARDDHQCLFPVALW